VRQSLVAAVALASVVLLATPAGRASPIVKINHYGTGAVAAYNRCVLQANGDQLCEDYIIGFGTQGFTRDGVPRDAVGVSVEHYEAFVHPDGSADEFVAEFGFNDQIAGSYERARLTFARMTGGTVALNDIDPISGNLVPNGRIATLGPFEWTAASLPYVFGNDGPFGFGLPRHFVEKCVTEVSNAHERFTTAQVTGTINGEPVSAFGPAYLPWPGTGPADAFGAIFDNRFTVVLNSHGVNCSLP